MLLRFPCFELWRLHWSRTSFADRITFMEGTLGSSCEFCLHYCFLLCLLLSLLRLLFCSDFYLSARTLVFIAVVFLFEIFQFFFGLVLRTLIFFVFRPLNTAQCMYFEPLRESDTVEPTPAAFQTSRESQEARGEGNRYTCFATAKNSTLRESGPCAFARLQRALYMYRYSCTGRDTGKGNGCVNGRKEERGED